MTCLPKAKRLDPGIPLVATVLPEAAIAAPEACEAVDNFDPHNILRLLVAELPFDPEAQWCAMPDREVLSVHGIGEDGLRMEGVDQVDALVVTAAAIEGPFQFVRAIKHRVSRRCLQPGGCENAAEGNTRPLADRAPTFNAVMPRNLAARRIPLQISQ